MTYIPGFKGFSLITEKIDSKTFEKFVSNRLAGAIKIADATKAKGGDSLLTYQHYKVKLPYYKKAAAGKFNIDEAKAELKKLLFLTQKHNEWLNNFTHIVSHNIRSNNNNIKSLVELLLENTENDGEMLLKMLKTSTNKLDETIYHLSEFVRFQNQIEKENVGHNIFLDRYLHNYHLNSLL
jgi:hypothetical protein